MALMLSQQIRVTSCVKVRRSSPKSWRIQQASAIAFATPVYFALALNRETVCWRLEDQDIRLSPRNTQYLEVEQQVPGQPAQSASE